MMCPPTVTVYLSCQFPVSSIYTITHHDNSLSISRLVYYYYTSCPTTRRPRCGRSFMNRKIPEVRGFSQVNRAFKICI